MQPAYAAASLAAEKVRSALARHLEAAQAELGEVATLPDIETIQSIVDAAFWASLRREEGYTPLISLAYVSREQVKQPMLFERPLPLAPKPLTRVAPAVERPGIHLGVWREHGELWVWGATRHLPANCFVLEVVAPGLLVIKHSRSEESAKFVNVAVLQGDQIKIVDQQAAMAPDCPSLLTSLLGLEAQFTSSGSSSVLIQLAVSMRAHRRGGSLLVVPVNTQTWQASILKPISYAVLPPFTGLADLIAEEAAGEPHDAWQDALRRLVDGIAGLTAVDGATVLSDRYDVLAFGAKIVRRSRWAQVSQLMLTEPIEGAAAAIVEPTQLGGTRHLSAAQFVHDQRDAIAMVASQDGRFTVFGWSPTEGMVHAHRIETLLL
jgi:hypothetical protein